MAVQVELGFLVDHRVSSPAGGFSLRILTNFLILLGARTQEGQADDSKNGPTSSGLHQKLDPRYKMPWEILREKNRGMATERTWNVPERPWNCPERLQKGPRKAPERSWLPLPSSPLPPTHIPNAASGSRAGKGARPRATNDALHAVRSSRGSLSLRHNVSIANTQACPTTKLN